MKKKKAEVIPEELLRVKKKIKELAKEKNCEVGIKVGKTSDLLVGWEKNM